MTTRPATGFDKLIVAGAQKLTRTELIEWLEWNDRHGIFSDADSRKEGIKPISRKEALTIVTRIITENA